ncbi:hypothetical protein LguiA_006772 [Lonicera macranthoides]
MNILYWNARGIANTSTQEALKDMCLQFKPCFVCLAEPMTDIKSVPSSYWRFLGLDLIGVNDRGDSPANLWLFAYIDVDDWNVQVVSQLDQHITISFKCQQVLCYISFVYASTAYVKRRVLWQSLLAHKQPSMPWMVVGDFNSVLGNHEVSGGNPPIRLSCEEFRSAIDGCDLIHVPVRGSLFTWAKTFRNPPRRVERRLDRSLCNASWISNWPSSNCHSHVRYASDHCPLIINFGDLTSRAPTSFRFLNVWCQHDGFANVVQEAWNSVPFSRNCTQTIINKLKATKKCLVEWNRNVFGNIHKAVLLASAELKDIQNKISQEGANLNALRAESEAYLKLSIAMRHQEVYWKQKSRQKWLQDGDRNTKFFHTAAKVKIAKARISCLVEGSTTITAPQEIEDCIVNFYKSLYSSAQSSEIVSSLISYVPHLVSDADNQMLLQVPSDEEVRAAVFGLDPSSAAGPDGFNGYFYHQCWSLVQRDVCKAVQEFFRLGVVHKHLNSNLVILLPKVKGACSVAQFRPIALSNFLFKIITKIISNRVSTIIAKLILPNQCGFIKGRNISSCITAVSECVNMLNKRSYGGNMCMVIDFIKAFDTIEWPFLFQVLGAFGFDSIFVGWIKAILESARLSFLVNGRVAGYFQCSRGVRQGDPLSPLLFILAEEALNRALHALVDHGSIKRMASTRNSIPPSHVMYADDMIIFCNASLPTVKTLMQLLDDYGAASGQFVNKTKSHIVLGDITQRRQQHLKEITGMNVLVLPFTYLGVPVFRGKPSLRYLLPLYDAILAKMDGWKGRLLSIAGRLQLVQSVIFNKLLYSFAVYKWPSSLLRKLEQAVRNFIWTGDCTKRKLVGPSIENMCKPYEEGGYGLRSLKAMNRAALVKTAWQMLVNDDALCSFVRTNVNLTSSGKRLKHCNSSLINGFKAATVIISSYAHWWVGSGTKIDFWHDQWLGGAMVDILRLPSMASISTKARVSDFLNRGTWCLPRSFKRAFPQVASQIDHVEIYNKGDSLIWTPSLTGDISFKSAYDVCRIHGGDFKWMSCVWCFYIPPRRSILFYRALQNRLPTEDNLRRCGMYLTSRCSMCKVASESVAHLFYECSFAKAIWAWVFNKFQHLVSFDGDFLAFVKHLLSQSMSSQVKELWIAAITAVFWGIWVQRNACKFENADSCTTRLCVAIGSWVQEAGLVAKGSMYNTVSDLMIIKNFRVQCRPPKAPKIVEVHWYPPLSGWIKCNTDGLSKNGIAACGGLFRDSSGHVCGLFVKKLGTGNAYFAEFSAVLIAVEQAALRGWNKVWFEMDSALTCLTFFKKSHAPPWQLRRRWEKCWAYLDSIEFRFSHVYREGNIPADILSNYALSFDVFKWWDDVIPEIQKAVSCNCIGAANYRFC